MTTTRRPNPATSTARTQAETRRAVLGLYAGHALFVAELEELRRRHRPEGVALPYPRRWREVNEVASGSRRSWTHRIEWPVHSIEEIVVTPEGEEGAGRYVADVKELAVAWGLDRFPDDLGSELIHHRVRTGGRFGVGLDSLYPLLGIESNVGLGRIDLPFMWLADDDGIEDGHPYDPPEKETVLAGPLRDVREYLLDRCAELIDAELERIAELIEARPEGIAERHKDFGFRFADTRPDQGRHLGWWFKRHALGMSAREIGDEDAELPVSEQAVRKAIAAIDRDLGISHPSTGTA